MLQWTTCGKGGLRRKRSHRNNTGAGYRCLRERAHLAQQQQQRIIPPKLRQRQFSGLPVGAPPPTPRQPLSTRGLA